MKTKITTIIAILFLSLNLFAGQDIEQPDSMYIHFTASDGTDSIVIHTLTDIDSIVYYAPVAATAPTTTSTAATAIKDTTATLGGDVTADGGANVTARGVEYSTTASFTEGTGTQIAANTTGTGAFTIDITGLTAETTYYFKAYATNSVGTTYGTEHNFTTSAASILISIGDYAYGGIVFYIIQSGSTGYDADVQHGLVCAVSDQNTGKAWSNGAYIFTGATGTSIGTGQTNTTAIVTNHNAGDYAAYFCDTLTLGGYDDWFLPSKDELYMMCANKTTINNTAANHDGSDFTTNWYWSSSEHLSFNYKAWYQDFDNKNQDFDFKDFAYYVRAVRAF